MSNSWWKRLFNLEDEDWEEENSRDSGNDNNSYRAPIGRLEDADRHIQVRMVKQYPDMNRNEKYTPSFEKVKRNGEHVSSLNDKKTTDNKRQSVKQRSEDHGFTPAYQKAGRRRPEPEDTYQNEASAKPSSDTPKEPLLKKKKAPFRRTEVPSPVYGFKPRPKVYRRASESDPVQNQPADAFISQKEQNPSSENDRLPAEPDHISKPPVLPVRQESAAQKEKLRPEKPSLQSFSPDDSSPFEKTNKTDDNFGAEITKKASPAEITKKEPELTSSTSVNEISESPSYIEQGSTERPSEEFKTEDSFIQNGSENAAAQISAYDKPESEVIQNPLSAARTRRGPSKVPYNVLMFRSDKQSLSTKETKEIRREAEPRQTSPSVVTGENLQTAEPLTMDLLNTPQADLYEDATWLDEQQHILQQTLQNFQVKAEMMGFVEGPTVTRFDIKLHPGVKVNKVINLTEDIKLSLAAKQIRIAPVPGKNTVGIEVPNDHRKSVYLKNLLESDAFRDQSSPLTAVLGQDVSGENIVTDLSKMPHGLIAGATGSGKSVCIHSLILSLIYKSNPDQLRLILIDPKVVELAAYQKLPHLAAPVITQPKEASLALKWAVEEMERRYHTFAEEGVRDITRYNAALEKQGIKEQSMPYIVIIIDELADLMMVSPQDVEEAICRIAQKARAAGIHLILATQRPSVDVITGLIKSNIPTRIAFSVSSQADSRTILDSGGAERLLGQGDMLFSENGVRDVKRIQGCFVSDEEIDRITDALAQMTAPPYLFDKEEISVQRQEAMEEEDDLFEEAGCFVIEQGQASVSSLQRRFRIGYNRAARLIDQLESHQVISESNGSKPRQVLMSVEGFKGTVVSQEMF